VLGQLIGLDPNEGMRLGMQAGELMAQAEHLGPLNPRVLLESGVSALFTPPEYGGSIERAQQLLEHAVALYATDKPAPPLPAWGREEAYVWLGQVYQKQGKNDKAREAYGQALAIAPKYGFAQSLLAALPK
jgi:tetratricopeptide (TPR) repeat protein